MALLTSLKFRQNVTDAAMNPAALAIPATSTTSNGASIDLGTAYSGGLNPRISGMELRLVIDAQTTTTLPNGQTIITDLEHSTDDISFTTLVDNWITVTGAGGVGAVQAADQIPIPPNANRYVRISATTNGSGTGRDSTYATLSVRR